MTVVGYGWAVVATLACTHAPVASLLQAPLVAPRLPRLHLQARPPSHAQAAVAMAVGHGYAPGVVRRWPFGGSRQRAMGRTRTTPLAAATVSSSSSTAGTGAGVEAEEAEVRLQDSRTPRPLNT